MELLAVECMALVGSAMRGRQLSFARLGAVIAAKERRESIEPKQGLEEAGDSKLEAARATETSVELCSPGVGYSNWAGERARDERGNPFEEERAWKSMALPVYHRTRGIKRPLGEHPEERRSGQPLVRCLSRCL